MRDYSDISRNNLATDGDYSDVCLVGVQDVNAAHVEGQLAQAAEADIVLHAEREVEALGGDVEVVVVALRGPLGVGAASLIVFISFII